MIIKGLAKIKISVLLILILIFNNTYSQQVDIDVAKNVALTFYKQTQDSERLSGWDGSVEFVKQDVGNVPTYTFWINNDFVVVNSDRKKRPINWFSLGGNFTSPDIKPPAMVLGLKRDTLQEALRTGEHSSVVTKSVPVLKDYSESWAALESGTILKSGTQGVGPLTTTQWNQGVFYNAGMPVDPAGPGGHCVVGCVAVAVGQYLKYEADAFGDFPSYGYAEHTWDPYPTQIADFGNTTYDYANMPDQLVSSTPANEKLEVSRLLGDVAVGLGTIYGSNSSIAGITGAWRAMLNHFSFSAGCREIYEEVFSEVEWTQLLVDELDAGGIVIYAGTTTNWSWSHAFIIDGYLIDATTGETTFHCNWGWGGSSDGYYNLDNLSPGGLVPLTIGTSAFFGIHPNDENINDDVTISGTWSPTTSINVRAGVTLTLSPGTTVSMPEGAELVIGGSLQANGTPADAILFTSATPGTFWNGIRVWTYDATFPQPSSLTHCVIEYAHRMMSGAGSTSFVSGGGIAFNQLGDYGHALTFDHNEVRFCEAIQGAGVYFRFQGGVFVGNYFHQNVLKTQSPFPWGVQGGGTAVSVQAKESMAFVQFDSCTFSFNTVADDDMFNSRGGALYMYSFGPVTKFSCTNSLFEGNVSEKGSSVYVNNTTLLQNCEFRNHYPILPYGARPEGIIYNRGENVSATDYVPASIDVVGCLFEDNGISGIWTASEDTVNIINSSFLNNNSPYATIVTIGELVHNPSVTGDVHVNLKNVLSWDNGDGLSVDWQAMNETPILDIQYSNIENGNSSIAPSLNYTLPETNIDQDPLCTETGQLSSNSPCINAGTPDTTGMNLPEFDIFGFVRVMYDAIDIGAAEYDGTVSVPTISSPSDDFLVFPNPNSGNFTVQIHDLSGLVLVKIYSTTGCLVEYQKVLDGNNYYLQVNRSDLSPGLYVLKIQHSSLIHKQKFIIE